MEVRKDFGWAAALGAGLLLLRLLVPGAAGFVRELLISPQGEEAIEAFYQTGCGDDDIEAVFGGTRDDR